MLSYDRLSLSASTFASQVKGIFAFEITNAAGKQGRWLLDLKNGNGKLYSGAEEAAKSGLKPDATLILSDEAYMAVVSKKAQPQQLFTTGKLKVKGNLALAMRFDLVTKPLEEAARSKL